MPETPISLRTPSACVFCHRANHLHLQHTIMGDHISLEWHCVACGKDWPVKRKDEIPLHSTLRILKIQT